MININVHLGHGKISVGNIIANYTESGEQINILTFDELLIPGKIGEDVSEKQIKHKIRVIVPTLETLDVIQLALDRIKSNILDSMVENVQNGKESEDVKES